MKSAVLITHRELGFIEENVKKLMKEGFEIIIAMDEPNDELLRIVRRYTLKATISDKRRGKWKALNDAVALSSGDYILFLDSDTRIVELGNSEEFDAVEIRKEVNASSLMEKLINIDYFNMFLTAKLTSKLNSCLSLNGAAFVIKKDVLLKLGGFRRRINEDTDLGVRVGLNGYKVGVCGRAITKAPSSFRDWFVQRERWSLGGAEVVVENFWSILKRPKLWVPYLFSFYPAIIGLILGLVLPDSVIFKALYFILPFMLFIPSKFVSLALLTVFEMHTLKNLFVIAISFIVWALAMFVPSKKNRYGIEFKLLPLYYFIYSPLWTMLCIVALAKVSVLRLMDKDLKVKGWVV
ncbi:glycosyltransferase family 2 protein [Archaeoglobales archaeon]|nr:MAG: glycosyltransferase family 2 protein [Archaeoglobales archaeon]